MGYAALADMGAAHLALGLGTTTGLNAALFALGTRAVSLTVIAMGMSLIRHRAEGDRFGRLTGWGRRVPWATAAVVVGGLSLAGLPPGPGFAVRWSIARLVARTNVGGALLLLLASVAVGIGVVRALMALLREPKPEYVGSELVKEIEAAHAKGKVEEKPLEREPRLAAGMIIFGLILSLVLAFYPQIHTSLIERVAENYTFFDLPPP
jgi:formate hydrogenlyase subunit 3/multisubunit Na+/H+ antiporter MnhD subunit